MRKINQKYILSIILMPALQLYFKIWPANKKVWPPLPKYIRSIYTYLDKLELIKLACSGLVLGLSQFAIMPTCLKMMIASKVVKNNSKNNDLNSLVYILDIPCRIGPQPSTFYITK